MTDRLALLNSRRVATGKPPLKSWKGSKAKLEEAIAALAHAIVPTTSHTTLPRIAREMGIDPKKARAMLRKEHGAAWKKLPEATIRELISA